MEVVNSTLSCELCPPTKLSLGDLRGSTTFRQFPGVKVRFDAFTAMFFRSGKVNVLGYRSPDDLTVVASAIEKYLHKVGYTSVVVKCHIKNVVVSASLHSRINLEKAYGLLRDNGCRCLLELEMYPGLRVRAKDKTSSLVYHTGAVIVTGTSDLTHARSFMSWLLELLKQ